MVIRPSIFDTFPIAAAQSTRMGGISKTPFASLNLGLSVQDEEAAVLENRALFCAELGTNMSHVAWGKQVHGPSVEVADVPGQYDGHDAFVTNVPGVFVAVSVADCTPVLIYDPVKEVCAAVHAGWKGTVARIVVNTLQTMQAQFGTRPADCVAWIGACIGPEAFEVNSDVADHFGAEEKRFDVEKQKFFVDLKQANANQLQESGVLQKHIEISPYCTVQNNDLFFSHRAEKGLTGRMWAMIGRLKN